MIDKLPRPGQARQRGLAHGPISMVAVNSYETAPWFRSQNGGGEIAGISDYSNGFRDQTGDF
ncbi:hypothetical protein [Bradyrhizobium sp.]|uniref:hypothetical protein n=1 Tax=Bradyrhizobium sp. TaxID=376 RepID=UPI001DD158FA|nr:hypothetical protein [Bradyrhizobium sp.]MBV8701980.1 hypothetical protein [Bradyrhizobium sp.]MBV8918753.1 hypothetical protein [Bradyrhizobium sp.]MBV9981449.1 hypothetical protein [Bradyrhizobium sp.]